MLQFDEYRANLSHESDQWATSNRGWAWTGPRESGPCFAHYLEYSDDCGKGHGKRIHVVIVGRGVVWVRNCADARRAIIAAYRRARKGR